MTIRRALRVATLAWIAAYGGACAHRPAHDSAADALAALPYVSSTDQTVYDAVLRHVAGEYGRAGEKIFVQTTTMVPCAPRGDVVFLDCIREGHPGPLDSRWANGSYVFAGLIADSTRKQLSAAFMNQSGAPRRLLPLDSSLFVLRARGGTSAEVVLSASWMPAATTSPTRQAGGHRPGNRRNREKHLDPTGQR